MVVNLVRSGRKQPQLFSASAGGKARHPLEGAVAIGAIASIFARLGVTDHATDAQALASNVTLALARKWRPTNFGELVGQEHVVRALTNALTQNRLHHAYLLTGHAWRGQDHAGAHHRQGAQLRDRHLGRRPAANAALAPRSTPDASSICSNWMRRPTPRSTTCASCWRTRCTRRPRGRFKVYIIDEVHMLSRSRLQRHAEDPGRAARST